MFKTLKTAAVTTLALAILVAPGFAQDEEVSDAVDKAMFCAAAYSVVTQVPGMTPEQISNAEAASTLAYAKAKTALEEDGVDPAEYDRLVGEYVDMAVENLTDANADLRYSDDECTALVSE